jgi:hypothetical protein
VRRAEAEWMGIIDSLEEVLEDVLNDMRLAQSEGIRADIIALDAFDSLDSYLTGIKRDLGV